MKVKIKKLYEDTIIPKKAHKQDAGFDLFAHSAFVMVYGVLTECKKNNNNGNWVIPYGEQILVKVGFSMSIPVGYEAQIRPRSGLSLKHGISITNSPATIDSGYIGEIGVILINVAKNGGFEFGQGDRIAQMVINKLPEVELIEVDELDETDRGNNGFGSTNI